MGQSYKNYPENATFLGVILLKNAYFPGLSPISHLSTTTTNFIYLKELQCIGGSMADIFLKFIHVDKNRLAIFL